MNLKGKVLLVLIIYGFYLIATKINITLAIIYFIAVGLILTFFNTPKGKGILGEVAVKRKIGRTNPKKNRYVVNDLTFYDGEKSVQVDHILINRSGIHVIETKNFGGRIYGSENDYEWTQVLAYGRHKNRFYSPIKQNEGHIKSLQIILKDFDVPYYSYITFTKRAEIMNRKDFSTEVIYVNNIRRRINRKEEVISDELAETIYNYLMDIKRSNTITNKEHVKSINERLKRNYK